MYQKIKLVSKRNQVYRIIEDNNKYISKTFSNQENMKKEIEILKLLNCYEVNVPDIISINNQTIILEDLGEVTLLDWYESLEKENSCEYTDVMIKLGQWMKKFYFATKSYFNQQMILSDVNFRNFIIKDNEIYGIDFEQSKPENIEIDAGKLIAYALNYDPAMTEWKINFCREFINILSLELKIDTKLILEEKNKEYENIKNRRKIYL